MLTKPVLTGTRCTLALLFALLPIQFLPAGITPSGTTAARAYKAFLPIAMQSGFTGMISPNDPLLPEQWSLARIATPQNWPQPGSQPAVLIAVIDTGVDFTHPDLAGKLRQDLARNFSAPGQSSQDALGHGTHVAGIAAAAVNNGIGIAGLGGQAAILPLKVVDAAGAGSFLSMTDAVDYAVAQGARVINISMGSPSSAGLTCTQAFPALQDAITRAYQKGVLVVAAAGNDTSGQPVAPADCMHVLGVAATDGDDRASSFSNFGADISVAAPGGWQAGHGVVSTCLGGGYCEKVGTSMAAPLVAGLAALVFTQHPDYSADQVASAILDNAADLGAPGYDPVFGCGRIDARATLARGAVGSHPLCSGAPTWSGMAIPVTAAVQSAPSEAVPGSYTPGRLVVQFQPGLSPAEMVAALEVVGAHLDQPGSGGFWTAQVATGNELSAVQTLSRDPRFLHAGLDYLAGVN